MDTDRLYRFLLRLFPPAFRARFGEDMAATFADRRRAATRDGWIAGAAFWMRTVGDVAAHALSERRAVRRVKGKRGVMTGWFDDLLTAGRGIIRRPGPSLSAAVMLALGLGFNVALFAVVHAVLLQPLPYHEPDRLVMLWTGRNADGTGAANSYLDIDDWRAAATTLDGVAAFNISLTALTGDGDPEQISGAVVEPAFFGVLGVPMQLGRGLEPGDELVALDAARPVVIAHGLWTRRFSADPAIVGRTITLDGRPRLVVGVVAERFVHPESSWRTEYWSPLTVSAGMRTQRAFHFLRAVARVRDGVTVEAARSELDGIGRQLMAAHPQTNTEPVVVVPIADELAGNSRLLALLFLFATTLVLCLGAANNLNLLLARVNGRRVELAVRAALGASRGRLARQILTESLLLGLAAGAAGLLLAAIGLRLFQATTPIALPGHTPPTLNAAVVLFALALSAITGLLCGLAPAMRVARARLTSSVSEVRGSTGLEVSRGRTILVAVEMMLAVPLLVGALLLVRTLVGLQQVDPGFDSQHTAQFRVSLPAARYASADARQAFFRDLIARLSAMPGVTAAGATSSLPLEHMNNTGGSIVYELGDGTQRETGVGTRSVTPRYFDALGVPLRAGRIFTDGAADDATVVVNQRAADALWGADSAVGRRLRRGRLDSPAGEIRWLTVVGVVGDMRHDALDRLPDAEIFEPFRGDWSTMSVVARTTGDPAALGGAVRSVVGDIDRSLPVVNCGPVQQFLDVELAGPRFGVLCAAIFSVLGVTLAAFGTFAVLSLLVAQRRREIGIRMALGATPGRVRRLVLTQSLLPALVGCLAGAVVARLMARALASQLFGVAADDTLSLTLGLTGLALVALVASWVPTRRAVRTDPIVTLRAET